MWNGEKQGKRKILIVSIQATLNGACMLYLHTYAYMVATIIIKGKETRNLGGKKRGSKGRDRGGVGGRR